MINCIGCKHRNCPWYCERCIGWNLYEANGLVAKENIDISIEMELLKTATTVQSGRTKKELLKVKKVIFNAPATIVLWTDGTKTIVKSGDYDVYDPEKGLAMAIAKKALGNQGNYYNVFKKWLPKENGVTGTDKPNVILSSEELAEKMGCTKATIQRQCRNGLHPGAKKIKGNWQIPYIG